MNGMDRERKNAGKRELSAPKLLAASAIRALEEAFAASGVTHETMMDRAARAMFAAMKEELSCLPHVTVICGRGNNGGDGYALAELIAETGCEVCIVTAKGVSPDREPALTFCRAFKDRGGRVIEDAREALLAIGKADVVIDAVYGIGFRGEITAEDPYFMLLKAANASGAFRVALDVPSGVSADDGRVGGLAFRAGLTLTVTSSKAGLHSYPGKAYAGEVRVVSIGIPDALASEAPTSAVLADETFAAYFLPPYHTLDHKGDHGRVLAVCGSKDMTGAALMSAETALRSGAGLVTLASEEDVTRAAKVRLPELLYRTFSFEDGAQTKAILDGIDGYDAILIGCGLGKSEEKRRFIENVLKTARGQVILDADGINLLAAHIDVLKEAKRPPVLTPHPGEFARITGKEIAAVNADRLRLAQSFAEEYRCILVLKGPATVTAAYDGRTAINTTGCAAMGKGGSGDVLAGLMAGFAARSGIGAFEAAVCAVFLHGRGGEEAAREISEFGVLPTDMIGRIARLLP